MWWGPSRILTNQNLAGAHTGAHTGVIGKSSAKKVNAHTGACTG